jgi:hypothetical protein
VAEAVGTGEPQFPQMAHSTSEDGKGAGTLQTSAGRL